MRVGCIFKLPSGELRELTNGEIIGRAWSAALRIADPRVSEAHAIVSLRGSALRLLALRGRFAVADKPLQDLELRVGQVIHFTRDIALEVVEVILPHEVLALEGDGLARHVLAGVSSLHAAPRPSLVPGFESDADALIWHDGLGWVLRFSDGEDRPLVVGDSFSVGDRNFHAVSVVVEEAGHSTTRGIGGIDRPIRVVARYDSVHLIRDDEPPVVLSGNSARLLSELATIGLPVAWEALAQEIWPDESELVALRRRFDSTVARLRQRLRDARIRADLVRADGSGKFEIYLLPTDSVEDET